MRPRVLLVGRTRYRLPLDPGLGKKFDALRELIDLRVIATAGGGSAGDETFELVPAAAGGAGFYGSLPLRVARAVRRFRPAAIVTQSPYEAAAVLAAPCRRPRLVVEVHGDWRTASRLYGSSGRGLVAPLADRVASLALRRADAVRAVSDFTADLVREEGVEPAAVFRTYTDLEAFLEQPRRPLPERPEALFVGVLERYKNVDGLVEAWRRAAPRVPGARLRIVGRGPLADLVERLVADRPEQTARASSLTSAGVAEALDAASLLVLPSRSEGLPRVVVEAFCRGRAVIGARAGGIGDAVLDGENGLLVEVEDVEGLADALVRALGDRALAERLSEGAARSAERWTTTPRAYAEQVLALVTGANAA